MVFLFNDVNSNVRIVTTILKGRLANNLMGFNLVGNQEVLCESEEDDYYEE